MECQILINILGKAYFKSLNKLVLLNNSISDINILEKVNFRELKELNLFLIKNNELLRLNNIKLKKIN